jgi:isocitrate dehydrogenase
MDIVIVRENEEDLYAGIEHQQTDEVVQCLKLISRPGCEKIVVMLLNMPNNKIAKK